MRAAVTAFQTVRKGIWFITRPQTHGVNAIPMTPQGRVVMVKLTYAKGWRLPGGGRKRDEDPEAAILRELREEIGLTGYTEVRHLLVFHERPDRKHDTRHMFLVTGVTYVPRRSLEIDDIAEFAPEDVPEQARQWIPGEFLNPF
ncbi:MAG TPA: NUDIX domain-containing protein [Allosphingosinicella sp.]